jgi:hypothetical protein
MTAVPMTVLPDPVGDTTTTRFRFARNARAAAAALAWYGRSFIARPSSRASAATRSA